MKYWTACQVALCFLVWICRLATTKLRLSQPTSICLLLLVNSICLNSKSCPLGWTMPLVPFNALWMNLWMGLKSSVVFAWMISLCIISVCSNIWGIFILYCLICRTACCLLSNPSVFFSRARYTFFAMWFHLVGWHQNHQRCWPSMILQLLLMSRTYVLF